MGAPIERDETAAEIQLLTANAATNNDNTAQGTGPGTAGPAGGTAAGMGMQMGGGGLTLDDAKVPSRVAVKKISSQVSLEARRKEDMEVRRKK